MGTILCVLRDRAGRLSNGGRPGAGHPDMAKIITDSQRKREVLYGGELSPAELLVDETLRLVWDGRIDLAAAGS